LGNITYGSNVSPANRELGGACELGGAVTPAELGGAVTPAELRGAVEFAHEL